MYVSLPQAVIAVPQAVIAVPQAVIAAEAGTQALSNRHCRGGGNPGSLKPSFPRRREPRLSRDVATNPLAAATSPLTAATFNKHELQQITAFP